jgi:hypothetical protein
VSAAAHSPGSRFDEENTGFTLDEEAEGPWHEEGYAYHHVLAHLAAAPG